MAKLTPEERILFLASRLNPRSENIRQIEHIISSGKDHINFNEMIQIAVNHGVAPLLHKNLGKVDLIPDNVRGKLKDIYWGAASINLKKSHETLKILDALNKNKIEAIPLKGAIASELIFKDPALYYGTDIDILVRPSKLQQAKTILIDMGYQYDNKNEADLLSSHYHLALFKGKHFVELHWNLVKRYFRISPDFWWKNTSIQKHMSHDILCLEPEKYLVYLIFRLHSHMFYPLKFFVLILEICNTYYKEINWNYFVQLTIKFRMKKLAFFSLIFIHDHFGAHITKNIVNKKIMGYNVFADSIIHMLFRDIQRPYIRKILHVFLLDSKHHIFISLFKRLFPGKSELRLRYSISEGSKKIYVYYILNPVLLPLLLLKKKHADTTKNSF